MAYNPSKDVVAGRTAAQIEKAKRQAVKSSKKKRCKKGKSCGATCINSGKVCMVDLPWVSAQGLTKVAKEIQKGSGVKPKDKTKPKQAPKPKPVKPVKAAKEPTIPLAPLANKADYDKLMKDTYSVSDNPKLSEDSKTIAQITGKKNTSFPSNFLYPDDSVKQNALAIRDKIGSQVISDGMAALTLFTSSYNWSKKIRDADRGVFEPGMSKASKQTLINSGDNLNRLLTSPLLPKTEVEKFRGFRASPDRLAQFIESAKNGESFTLGSVNSWSSALRVGRRFANRDISEAPERTERVIFRTINKRGVPIEYITQITNEDEILTPRGTNYRYTGYRAITEDNGKVYHIFDMEEMP